MNFPPDTRIDLACAAPDHYREALRFVSIEDGHAIATDASMLAVIPVQVEPDDDPAATLIPAVAIAAASAVKPPDAPTRMRLEKDKVTWPDRENGIHGMEHDGSCYRYPTWRNAIPSPAKPIRITLDASRLLKLAQALPGGQAQVHLHIDPDRPENPVLVTKPHQPGLAILAPCHFVTDPTAQLDQHPTYRFSHLPSRLADAKAACAAAGEFWTAEKEAAVIADHSPQ